MTLENYISEAVSHGKFRSYTLEIENIASLEDLEMFLRSNGYHQIDMVGSKEMLDMFNAKDKAYCFYKTSSGNPMAVQVFVGPLFCIYRFYLDKSEKHLNGECYWNKLKYGHVLNGSTTVRYALKMIRDNN
jgi:hypothetical protein